MNLRFKVHAKVWPDMLQAAQAFAWFLGTIWWMTQGEFFIAILCVVVLAKCARILFFQSLVRTLLNQILDSKEVLAIVLTNKELLMKIMRDKKILNQIMNDYTKEKENDQTGDL